MPTREAPDLTAEHWKVQYERQSAALRAAEHTNTILIDRLTEVSELALAHGVNVGAFTLHLDQIAAAAVNAAADAATANSYRESVRAATVRTRSRLAGSRPAVLLAGLLNELEKLDTATSRQIGRNRATTRDRIKQRRATIAALTATPESRRIERARASAVAQPHTARSR